MRYNAFALSIFCLAAVSPGAWGQTPPSKLNCNQAGMVADLVTFCQLREAVLPSADSFTVDTVNGGVSVQTWDGPGILVRARIQTAADDYFLAEALAGQVVVDTSTGNVVVTGPSTNSRQSWSARLEIYVPAATGIAITTVNGSIAVRDVQGPLQFHTVNGGVSLAGVGGNVQGSVVNGSIFLGVGGDHWAGQTLDVKTVNGSIEIEVPADCSAHVTASVAMGVISTNFPVQIPAGRGLFGQSISFDVGSGAAGGSAIRMATTIGTIQLRRMD
jgi:DUF4097 and DUF4098 domain-containing protein YvlB